MPDRTEHQRVCGYLGRVEVSREDRSETLTHIATEDGPRYPLLAPGAGHDDGDPR